MGKPSKDRVPESKSKVSWRLRWAFSKAKEMKLRDLTLEKLAAESDLSKCYLSRSFSLLAGCSFEAYRKNRRIAEGKRLLLETPLPLEQIAFFLGFSRLEEFTEMFEKATGYKPNAYRECAPGPGVQLPDRAGTTTPL